MECDDKLNASDATTLDYLKYQKRYLVGFIKEVVELLRGDVSDDMVDLREKGKTVLIQAGVKI